MTFGELLGGLFVWITFAALLMAIRAPRARIAAGLLLLGLAIVMAVLAVWRWNDGRQVYFVRVFAIATCLAIPGTLLFRWGRRTSPA